MISAEVETLTETTETKAPTVVPEKKESEEDIRKRARKPPTVGPCRRCGKDRQLNNLMLCYFCWVKTVLEEKTGWREGEPHPPGCCCEIECKIERGGFS